MFKTIFANVQVGIYSTRVYIILLMTGVFVLIIYTSSEARSQQIIIRNPSSQQFQQLNSKYPSILSCPCTHTSIQSSTFMYNNVSFHPFCTSAFVRDPVWLQYWTMTFFNGTVDRSPPFDWPDFRKTGLKFINYVRTYCDFAMTTVNKMLDIYHAEQFFSAQPLNQMEFNAQSQEWNSTLFGQVYKEAENFTYNKLYCSTSTIYSGSKTFLGMSRYFLLRGSCISQRLYKGNSKKYMKRNDAETLH